MHARKPGPYLVKSSPRASTGTARKTGTLIAQTGIYKVSHGEHRLPHEVILFEGEQFPRCCKCEDEVLFELVYAAQENCNSYSQRVVLYELPSLDEAV